MRASRRAIAMAVIGALCAATLAVAPEPARGDSATPLNHGTLTVCIRRGPNTCNLYNGTVQLQPNPGLISNTLTLYDRQFFFVSQRMVGRVEAIGVGGSTAVLTIDIGSAFFFLPLWLGKITFTDPGAGVAVSLGVWFEPIVVMCRLLNTCPAGTYSVTGYTGIPFLAQSWPDTTVGTFSITP